MIASAGRPPRRRSTALVGVATVALAAAQLAPSVTAVPAIRRRLFPRLAGTGGPGRIALTFDDGPDPESTPRFLAVLAEHRVRATFFLLGTMLARSPRLAGEIAAGGTRWPSTAGPTATCCAGGRWPPTGTWPGPVRSSRPPAV